MNWMPDGRTLVALLLGGPITFVCSYHYYVKASKELIKETELLKKYNNMMLTFMEAVNLEKHGIKFERNEKGEIVGWKPIKGTVNIVLPAITASVKGTVGLPPEKKGKQEKPE